MTNMTIDKPTALFVVCTAYNENNIFYLIVIVSPIIQSVWRDRKGARKERELGMRESAGTVRRRDGLPLIFWLSYYMNQSINQFVCLIEILGPEYASLAKKCNKATYGGRRIVSYCYCSLLAL